MLKNVLLALAADDGTREGAAGTAPGDVTAGRGISHDDFSCNPQIASRGPARKRVFIA